MGLYQEHFGRDDTETAEMLGQPVLAKPCSCSGPFLTRRGLGSGKVGVWGLGKKGSGVWARRGQGSGQEGVRGLGKKGSGKVGVLSLIHI